MKSFVIVFLVIACIVTFSLASSSQPCCQPDNCGNDCANNNNNQNNVLFAQVYNLDEEEEEVASYEMDEEVASTLEAQSLALKLSAVPRNGYQTVGSKCAVNCGWVSSHTSVANRVNSAFKGCNKAWVVYQPRNGEQCIKASDVVTSTQYTRDYYSFIALCRNYTATGCRQVARDVYLTIGKAAMFQNYDPVSETGTVPTKLVQLALDDGLSVNLGAVAITPSIFNNLGAINVATDNSGSTNSNNAAADNGAAASVPPQIGA